MARRGKLVDLVKPISTSKEFQEWVEKSDQVLVVLDIHKTWCGPCEVVKPAFERLWLDHDEADKRVKFMSVDQAILSDEQKEALPLNDGCKPLFLVYKHKVLIGKVQGVNAPEIVGLVTENIFPIEEEE